MIYPLKLKDKVELSPTSLYARKQFQQAGKGHMKLEETGTVVKVLKRFRKR